MKRSDLALRVTRALHISEDSVDEALGASTILVQELLAGRKAIGLSAVVGASAFNSIMDAVGQMSAARASLVKAHHALQADAAQIGVRNLSELMGPGQTKPDRAGIQPTGLSPDVAAA